MKLEEIPASTVRQAVEIYLARAYAGASRWRAPCPSLEGGETAKDLVARFSDESQQDGERRIARYVLRLGNSRYPHMKLLLEESILRGEFAFAVDTHDDLNVSPGAPDYDRWNAVRAHNRDVAEGIVRAWKAAGICTVDDIRALLGPVEPIVASARSVLVVDDDPSIRETIADLLRRAGLRVRTAADGAIALRMVGEEPPHLILMDYQMPGMDGVAACEALKADPRTAPIPVLLATRSQVDLASLAFADGFLVKPYRQDVLFSLVRKLLS